ncbi:hypothetical protein [Methylobacterium sp. A54F]
MAKQRLKKRVRLDLEPIYRNRAVRIAHSHTPATRPSTKVRTPAPLNLEGLHQRGRLRLVLREIMTRFAQADRTHRDAIDQEVMNCVEIARFLAGDDPHNPRYHSDEWAVFWQQHAPNATQALKFVLKKAHADAKKASFYFRATYQMFEREVKAEDYPRLITEGGGYQALANRSLRFPRVKPVTTITPSTPTTSWEQTSDAQTHVQGAKSSTDEPLGKVVEEETPSTRQPTTRAAEPLLLAATFERGGCLFPDLPAGCHVRAHLTITESSSGQRTVCIWHAVRASKK